MFKGKMITTAIPERVYTLCKIVEKGSITSNDLKEKMEPEFLKNGSLYFNDYKNAAEELGLITIADDLITLAVELKTISDMRIYVNSQLEKFNTGQFYLVTNAYFEKGKDIFKEDKNIANLGPLFSEMTGMQVDAVAMRAWRFWASFLGFGYLQDMFVIPNARVFLEDIISTSDFEKNKKYSVSEFMSLLGSKKNIVISNDGDKKLNYGVSNGLRALHDAGKIKIEHILDQTDLWTLSPLKAYSNDSTITNITVL